MRFAPKKRSDWPNEPGNVHINYSHTKHSHVFGQCLCSIFSCFHSRSQIMSADINFGKKVQHCFWIVCGDVTKIPQMSTYRESFRIVSHRGAMGDRDHEWDEARRASRRCWCPFREGTPQKQFEWKLPVGWRPRALFDAGDAPWLAKMYGDGQSLGKPCANQTITHINIPPRGLRGQGRTHCLSNMPIHMFHTLCYAWIAGLKHSPTHPRARRHFRSEFSRSVGRNQKAF